MEDVGVVTEAAARGVAANFLEHFKDLKDPAGGWQDHLPAGPSPYKRVLNESLAAQNIENPPQPFVLPPPEIFPERAI